MVLLVGDVAFNNPNLPSLPGTAEEIHSLDAIAKQSGFYTTLLTRESATTAAVLSQLPNANYVHLASQGFVQSPGQALGDGSILTRDVVLAPSDSGSSPNRDPLLASGIFLATEKGTERSEGTVARITAEDLLAVDLRNCDLVTLSACEGGLGQSVVGDGLIGLRSAIMAAGSRSMLVALWDVDDRTTTELMKEFYNNLWRKHLCPAESLQKAQQAVRANTKSQNTWNWAGWILIGEGW
jgi:CHAT domain-containing protein